MVLIADSRNDRFRNKRDKSSSRAALGRQKRNGELGLFEYVDGFDEDGKYLHEWVIEFSTVERTEPVKYFAMALKAQKEIEPEQAAHDRAGQRDTRKGRHNLR